jgi:hypothetical protein
MRILLLGPSAAARRNLAERGDAVATTVAVDACRIRVLRFIIVFPVKQFVEILNSRGFFLIVAEWKARYGLTAASGNTSEAIQYGRFYLSPVL